MSKSTDIEQFISLIKQPDEIIELRYDRQESERKVRYSGFYNDHKKLAKDAARFPSNSYFTINRLKSDTPVTNQLARCKKGGCTKSTDIERRTLLYIDVDPNRASGTPSTDEQHQAAIEFAEYIRSQLGWPLLLCDSGNGAALFGKIDLSTDSPLVKNVLKAIKAKWEPPGLTVDLTVASLARIGRLIGTVNCKGGQPGRTSKIIDAPELSIISEAQLEAFAPIPPEQIEKTRVQQMVTSWTFGKTPEEQIENIRLLLTVHKVGFQESDNANNRSVMCHWFHFRCVLRPDQDDANNWIVVHPTQGVSGGCHHGKCHGKGLIAILSVIAPEIAAQAAEAYDDSHRLARSYLQSRPPLVIWQKVPFVYQDGFYIEDSKESIKAELNLHIKAEFNILGFKETPNVTGTIVRDVYSAVEAITFDRQQTVPHWVK